jgi:fatty acid-binding protein DegV
MDSFCIITDDVAQFSQHDGHQNIHFQIINHQIASEKSYSGDSIESYRDLFPANQKSFIKPPNSIDLSKIIKPAGMSFDEVFLITTSNGIDPIYSSVAEICSKNQGKAHFHVIDSQTLSAGEGHLIEFTSELIQKHFPGRIIEEKIRETIPNIYTLLCAPNLSYLHAAGFLDAGQMIIGESLSLYPVFSLEDGKLNPLEKYKNPQNVIEYFIEFISEFEALEKVVFLLPSTLSVESKFVLQYMEEFLPETHFSEYKLNNFLVNLVGPRGFGLVVIEKA